MALFYSAINSGEGYNVDAKDSGKLSKVRIRGYVRVGEFNILTH